MDMVTAMPMRRERSASRPAVTPADPNRRLMVVWSIVLAALGLMVIAESSALAGSNWSLAAIELVILTWITELLPVTLNSRSSTEAVLTVSTAFGLAATFASGPVVGMVAFCGAVVISEVIDGQGWRKTGFNTSMYALLTLLASWTIELLLGSRLITAGNLRVHELIAIAGASSVFIVANTAIVMGLLLYASRFPPKECLRALFTQQLVAQLALVGVIPLVLLVAAHASILLPTLLIPVAVSRRNIQVVAERERRLRHDVLTDLPNQLSLVEELDRRTSSFQDGVVVLLNLQNHRELNMSLGLPTGDKALQLVAQRLRGLAERIESSGGDPYIARVGGDEFAVLTSWTVTAHIADALRQVFAVPFGISGMQIELQAAIGIAELRPVDAWTLMHRAETALYEATSRPDNVMVYSPTLERTDPDKLGLLAELRSALERGEIDVHLQPIVSTSDGSMLGVEALARWTHPQRGPIPPGVFVPVAEQSGLVRELTYQVLDRSLMALRKLRETVPDAYVSVNVSPRTLHDPNLAPALRHSLAWCGLPPSALLLEVTEGTLMLDQERSLQAVREIAEMGVRFALDDFGTGYSSLSMLSVMPVDVLKIDRSFITTMHPNTRESSITMSTIELGHRLGMTVVGEGIETAEVWDQLRDAGCDAAQGYFVRRPCPLPELLEWLCERQMINS